GGEKRPKPTFHHHKKWRLRRKPAKKPSTPCCQSLGEGVRRLLLRLRAAVLIVMLFSGMPGYYLTHHFLLNPSLAALEAHLEPGFCEVASSISMRGTKNCTWSSCRQGCTAQELYICWQVLVIPHRDGFNLTQNSQNSNHSEEENENYPILQALMAMPVDEPEYGTDILEDATETNLSKTSLGVYMNRQNLTTDTSMDNESSLNSSVNQTGLVKLKINAAGCGYTSCYDWWREYGKPGTTFPCYIGATGDIAVPHFDSQQATRRVVLGTLPLILGAVSLILMYWLYWRKGHKDETLSLAPSRSARIVKSQQIKAQLLLQMAKEDKIKPRSKLNIWSFVFRSKRMARIKPYRTEDDLEMPTKPNEEEINTISRNCELRVYNEKRRLSPAEQWLKVAIWAATRHPCISAARKFAEVEFDKIDES
ncbi:hypothetical protein SK128_019064, partial [Halocaridina rubra]